MSLKNFMSYEDAATVLGEYADKVNELKSGLINKQNIAMFTSEWSQNLIVPQGMCTLIMAAQANQSAKSLIWSYNSYNGILTNLTGGSETITVTKNSGDNTITITNSGGVVCALVFGQEK